MRVVWTAPFERQVAALGKKFRRARADLDAFLDDFSPRLGVSIGRSILKFRIGNSSIPTGKKGGFRLLAMWYPERKVVLPFLAYSKTDLENPTADQILKAAHAALSDWESGPSHAAADSPLAP